jgi:pimeloyl-ACP methyl ester carboxylesterase
VLGALTNVVADSDANAQLRALSADASFLSDARKRCATEARLAAALDRARAEGRPVILVAHSLGSVVAYDYLSARPESALVQRLVTIGSPIGASSLRQLLIGGDSTDTLARPTDVREWVNIHNGQDVFATSLLGTNGVTDITTSPPAGELDPHEMIGYLRTPTTALEVLRGWCAAFTTKRPLGCKDVP